jgi:hypothetical protein
VHSGYKTQFIGCVVVPRRWNRITVFLRACTVNQIGTPHQQKLHRNRLALAQLQSRHSELDTQNAAHEMVPSELDTQKSSHSA